MARIYVCGLDDMPDLVVDLRPGRVISLLPQSQQPETPMGVAPANHLRIAVDDIDEPQPGHTVPDRPHVEALLAFLRAAPPSESILIHCLAGVSRSPAAALIAVALEAPGREREAAQALRAAARFADPNRLLVALADDLLGRSGRLVAALEAMTPPDFEELGVFSLPRFLPGSPR